MFTDKLVSTTEALYSWSLRRAIRNLEKQELHYATSINDLKADLNKWQEFTERVTQTANANYLLKTGRVTQKLSEIITKLNLYQNKLEDVTDLTTTANLGEN
jgi:prefoldin subunit 5